jgi:ParB family chromosome partitioning protein
MADSKRGLGRGLEQLLPSTAWLKEDDIQLFYCGVDRLDSNPYQPRHHIEDERFPELVQSIREKGVLQPVLVSRTEQPDRYRILAGERRWRAAMAAGLTEVPVLVRDATSVEALELALIENIQRSDLSCIEEARAYRQLQADFGLGQEQVAARVGKSRSTVANLLRLLQLPPSIQEDLLTDRLTMGHARALLSLEGAEARERIRDLIVSRGLSVRQTEQLVKATLRPSPSKPSSNPQWQRWQQALSAHLGGKVRLRRTDSGDTLSITVTDEAQLKDLIRRLGVDLELSE